jgi:hypothetical protein
MGTQAGLLQEQEVLQVTGHFLQVHSVREHPLQPTHVAAKGVPHLEDSAVFEKRAKRVKHTSDQCQ